MKLKPIPLNTVVHTPTEAEAKELLAILHENGYRWYCSGKEEGWENFGDETCYRINTHDNVYHTCDREWYETTCKYCRLPILTLAEFKEKYVEEEKPQPKFKVGDKAVVVTNKYGIKGVVGGVCEITEVLPHGYHLKSPTGYWYATESDLEPYTEPETKPTEDMETKEKQKGEKGNNSENSQSNNLSQDVANCDKPEDKQLNLCELLKGHEGETFYSPIVGDCTLKAITDYIYVAVNDHPSYCFFLDGRREKSGAVVFFPSRDLYEQYPLDPYTAWMKWQEEQKKHWLLVTVWIDDLECESDTAIDTDKIYFRTPADRDKCIGEIEAIIEKYSKK